MEKENEGRSKDKQETKHDIPEDFFDPQPKPILLQTEPQSKVIRQTRQPSPSRHDKSARNEADIVRHLLQILHLLFLHDFKRLLRRLFHAGLLRLEGSGFANAGKCEGCGAEEAAAAGGGVSRA